jgi:cytochrome c-type biogenesis protein CcmE
LSVVLGTSSDGLQFGRSVDQVLEGGGQDEGKVLTIEGRLVHGSLMKRDQPCEYRFELSSKEANRDGRLEVRYPVCIVPDNFRDVAGIDVDVTATGRMQGGVLVADNISTKCPTKYEMQQQQELGVQAPHGAPSDAAIDGLGLQPDEPKKTLGFDD